MNLGVVESVESRALFKKMKVNIEKVVFEAIFQKSSMANLCQYLVLYLDIK